MLVEELQYQLPSELIARYPTQRRDEARLLMVGEQGVAHRRVSELPSLLPAGSLLVVNDTRVIPARLLGRKQDTGGKVELLLVRHLGAAEIPESAALGSLEETGSETPCCQRWLAMARASHRVRAGLVVAVGDRLYAFVEREPDDDGLVRVVLVPRSPRSVEALIEAEGHVPLPPYIRRDDEPADHERYQTRFARVPGAVAAPTAGLHFSDELIAALRQRVAITAITLHVGPGTFRPVTVDDLDDHPMHSELFEVNETTAAAVERTRRAGAAVIAVGTTVVRALETAAVAGGLVRAMRGETSLIIQPGHRFVVVDGLITNFHLPGSTLLALAYAFGGSRRVAAAYREAIARRYRFYSYGDAMFIPRCAAPRSAP